MAQPPKKPAGKKPAPKKAGAQGAPAPGVSSAHPAPQPIKLVAARSRAGAGWEEFAGRVLAYAQENPAVTFVGLVASALGIALLFNRI